MQRMALFFLLAATAVLMSPQQISWAGEETSPLRTFAFPPDPMFFQPGPGQEIANTYCLICHSADYVYTQPLFSQEKWESIVVKMKNTFGCPIPDDQISPLSAYLYGQNSVNPASSPGHP